MTVSRKQLQSLAGKAVSVESLDDIPPIVRNWARRLPGSKLKRGSFKYAAYRFADMLESAHDPSPRNLLEDYNLPHNIFVEGNSKLPFWSFSTLPGADCPGAGECCAHGWRCQQFLDHHCSSSSVIQLATQTSFCFTIPSLKQAGALHTKILSISDGDRHSTQ